MNGEYKQSLNNARRKYTDKFGQRLLVEDDYQVLHPSRSRSRDRDVKLDLGQNSEGGTMKSRRKSKRSAHHASQSPYSKRSRKRSRSPTKSRSPGKSPSRGTSRATDHSPLSVPNNQTDGGVVIQRKYSGKYSAKNRS